MTSCEICEDTSRGPRLYQIVWRIHPVRAFEERDREALYGRSMAYNVASEAVRKREWTIVADWLEAHDAGSYPDTEDAERETWFEWWLDRECNL